MPEYLLRLIDKDCNQSPSKQKTVDGRYRSDFSARFEVACAVLALICGVLRTLGASGAILEAISGRCKGGQLQIENLTCARDRQWHNLPGSKEQDAHYDLHKSQVVEMLLAGLLTGAALSLLIPTATASSGSYSAGSHNYSSKGPFPPLAPVQVPRGAILISSPMLIHKGGAGADLPPGLSHRSSLFICAHQKVFTKVDGSGSREANIEGEEVVVASFGSADYDNTLLSRHRGPG